MLRRNEPLALEVAALAVVEPRRHLVMFRGAHQHVLVVALEADDLFRCARLGLDQEIHHVLASFAAVHVIAEEDEAMRFAGAMIQAIPVEIGQLGVAAMDVADGVGEHARNSVPVPRIFVAS